MVKGSGCFSKSTYTFKGHERTPLNIHVAKICNNYAPKSDYVCFPVSTRQSLTGDELGLNDFHEEMLDGPKEEYQVQYIILPDYHPTSQ